MKSSEIKFEVQQGWGDYKIVWMMKYEGGKAWNGYMKDGWLEWEEVKEGMLSDKLTPYMKIPGYGVNLQGLVDALSKVTPPVKEVETTSELKATKYHLEDMRKLVFSRVKY